MKKQKNKQFKQIENQAQDGRSMVEMLGVLAIIGVLSIGGIAGYRWGMDKHITNQILYEMNLNSAQLAMLLQKGNPEGVTLSLGSPYDENKFRTVDYGFEYACGEEASFGHDCQYLDETMYSMTATGLPKRVCNMLGDAVFGMAYYYDSEINGGDNECNDTGNTVTVFFDTDTTSNSETSPQPGNSDNPYTPTPEVTAATPTTAPTLAPTTTDIYPSTYSSTEATTYTSSATYSPTTYISSSTYSSTEITAYTSTYTATPLTITATPLTIDQNCSGHGTWDGYSCECTEIGWGGPDCSQPGSCSNHGLWVNVKGMNANGGFCSCEGDYGGPDCDIPNACNGRGKWEGYTSGCSCDHYNYSGWYGRYCDKCSGHGWYYTDTGKCECKAGYSGNDCENKE